MNQEIAWGGGKLVKLVLAICLLFLLSPKQTFTQEIIPGILYLEALSGEAHPTDNRIVQNDTLFDIFQQYGVYSYEQAAAFARTPSLWSVYKIKCTGDVEDLKTALEQQTSHLVGDFMYIYEQFTCYSPEDELWEAGELWHLNKIQADSAWNYTRSSDSIDVAVLDWFPPDIYHPDLITKINPPYHPMSGNPYRHLHDVYPVTHATAIAGFIAGETTETGEVPSGELASIGFNSNMIFYQDSENKQIFEALHASTVMGAEVISISSFSGCGQDTIPQSVYSALKEILDNNTVIVAAGGNGDMHCSGGPLGTFNGLVFDEIIVVSGTDSTDNFGVDDGQSGITHFSNYHSIDLCAPGYYMTSSANTWLKNEYVIDTITGDTLEVIDSIPNPNLYSGGHSGTSFSAPITAGVAALIKSINPCLTPEDVQYILKSTTDTIVDRLQYPGTIGTGRLNAYKAVKLAHDSYNFTNYTVHNGEDITWTVSHFIDTLYIEPGGKLTINADCFFNVAGAAIIDTMAILTVNNSILTTSCRSVWYGIRVWGRKTASQFPDGNNNCVQGRLILNGATVKNAHEAVSLWKYNDFSSMGGYIIANNSTFINNRRAVEFMRYQNYDPATLYPAPNLSEFINCNFIHDEHYLYDSPLYGFVSLWGVEGVTFEACTFSNNSTSLYNDEGNLMNPSLSGFGLWAVDAGFTVTAHTEGQQVDSSRFEKLEYGIHAMAANGTSRASIGNIFIDESLFDQNITGIYTSAIYQPSIIRNSFSMNPIDTATSTVFGGVYFDNYTTGFIIEENHFADHNVNWIGQPTKKSIGLCINNSGTDNNLVYNNRFEDLYIAILAQNNNRNDRMQTGLEIKCNELYNNQFDIAVTADSNSPSDPGIKELQGSDGSNVKDPAGNIFSPSVGLTVEAWDIYTEVSGKFIEYWYHANQSGYDLRPDSVSPLIVRVRPNSIAGIFVKDIACPSNYAGGGGTGGLKNLVNNMDFKADSVSDLLALMVDGGDTDGTTTDVESAWPDETMEVRDDLLDKSPYLSDTVMVTTVLQEEVLPAAIVTEVLVANPQSAKSDRVLDEVYAREDITNNQIDQIEANEMITGAKESLEIKKSAYTAQRDYALNSLVVAYRNDTSVINPTDSIIAFLNMQDFAGAKYQLAFEYLANGDLQMAQDSLEAIPDNFNLDATALNEQAQLEDYFDVMVTLAQSGSNIYQMTATQTANLYTIHQNSNGRAGALARNILQIADTLTYKENYILPTEGAKTGKVRRRRANRSYENDKLKVYPNPARDYVIVEYQLVGDADKAVVKVIDNNGFIRQTIVKESNHNFVVIDTRQLGTGTYIAHVSSEGKLIGVCKFIIVN
ncbi:MAG: hypothetical protein DRJ05_06820 [Bacteroidetes bacterium]|nr:MAG: hypothetical protein DRJ05_06820 [Bacteroidota bacterium]